MSYYEIGRYLENYLKQITNEYNKNTQLFFCEGERINKIIQVSYGLGLNNLKYTIDRTVLIKRIRLLSNKILNDRLHINNLIIDLVNVNEYFSEINENVENITIYFTNLSNIDDDARVRICLELETNMFTEEEEKDIYTVNI